MVGKKQPKLQLKHKIDEVGGCEVSTTDTGHCLTVKHDAPLGTIVMHVPLERTLWVMDGVGAEATNLPLSLFSLSFLSLFSLLSLSSPSERRPGC